MADLSSEYASTNDALQGTINEALLQLGNSRSAVSTFASLASNFQLPTSPNDRDIQFQPPIEPQLQGLNSIQLPDLQVEGIQGNIPGSPAGPGFPIGNPPQKPKYRSGFEEFFVGDSDTPQEIIDRANREVCDWMEKYFPAMKDCFTDAPEQWMCDVISGVRPLGNSETAIEVAWRTAKANQSKEAAANRRTLPAEFTARGFTMPPGAMLATMERQYAAAFDATSAANRAAAIKDVEVQARLLEIAVTTGAQLKAGLATAMAQYYRVIASITNDEVQNGIEKAKLKANADAQFTDALVQYSRVEQAYYASLGSNSVGAGGVRASIYSAEVQGALAKLQIDEANQRNKLDVDKANADNKKTELQSNIDIARLETEVFSELMRGEATRVQAETQIGGYETEIFKAEIAGESARVDGAARAALASEGVADAFGQIGAAAANSAGSLVARIESVIP